MFAKQHMRNALGHEEHYLWDARLGVKTHMTGPNGIGSRWEYDETGRVTTTTTYIGQAYERIERSGKDTLHRYNLHVGNQVIAVHDITTAEADDTKRAFQTRYLHRDHLGSVSLIISAEIHGGEFKDGVKIAAAVTIARMGWEHTRE